MRHSILAALTALLLTQPVLADAADDALAALAAGEVATAQALAEPLANGSDPRGLFVLAEIAARDPANAREATDLYRRAAVLGHADASLRLALRALAGDGMDANPTDAETLLQGLVDQDFGPAQLALAQAYLDGALTEPEPGRTEALLESALANGLGHAGFLRGAIAAETDKAAALAWFEQGAALGDGMAALSAGLAWRDGLGTDANAEKAAPLLRQAADAGERDAQMALAGLYAEGQGVKRDLFTAADLYKAAAAQGETAAMAALAALYGEGRIGVRDRVSAYAWLKRAILAGATHYQADLDALAGKMKKADVEKGEALAVQ